MISSCAERPGSSGSGSGGVGHLLHEFWDWLTGKPPKWKRKQAEKNAEAVANWQQTLSKINIKGLPKEIKQCYKVASQLSGVPLPVMLAITMNETKFHDHFVCANGNLEGTRWDCGEMQVNTKENECPLANRLTHHLIVYDVNGHIYDNSHAQLLAEIEALGLKYVGGGKGRNCGDITHAEAVEYCRELDLNPEIINCVGRRSIKEDLGSPLNSDPACLSIFMGAYVLSKDMWLLKYDKRYYDTVLNDMKKYGGPAYQAALQNAGSNFIWVMAAYEYNGVSKCYGFKCYFYRFTKHINEIGHDIAGFIDKHLT